MNSGIEATRQLGADLLCNVECPECDAKVIYYHSSLSSNYLFVKCRSCGSMFVALEVPFHACGLMGPVIVPLPLDLQYFEQSVLEHCGLLVEATLRKEEA